MEYFLLYAVAMLLLLVVPAVYYRKEWAGNVTNLLFANRSLGLIFSALAINSHWFWAIAIFISPAIAYNWGIIGLLWFVIPNAMSLIVVALLSRKIRDRYPEGFSLTEYIREKFGNRVTAFYYVMFAAIALAGMLLAFTALFKFFTFVGIAYLVSPIYIVLIFGLITLLFSATGGIRTSVMTGSIQTIGWLVFLIFAFFTIGAVDFSFLSALGKNGLVTVFDFKFLTTFAIAFLITIIVGATSHGMMWQKSFSMPRENILPSYAIAAVIFAVMVFMMGSLGLYAFSAGLPIITPDTSQLTTILALLGPGALLMFGILLVGQTSTVMDACLNYLSSVTTREWIKTDKLWVARLMMVLFFLLAWALTWLQLEVWTIFMLMGVLRVSMFMPLVAMVNKIRFDERIVFYSSAIAVTGALYLSWTARAAKLPIFDMYSALFALGIGVIVVAYMMIKSSQYRV